LKNATCERFIWPVSAHPILGMTPGHDCESIAPRPTKSLALADDGPAAKLSVGKALLSLSFRPLIRAVTGLARG
jgi:hypothetical protein